MCKRGLSSIEHHPQRKDYRSSFCVGGFSCKGEHKIMSKYEQMASENLAGVGQEAVFYLNEECLGGGVIEDVFKDKESMQSKIENRENK